MIKISLIHPSRSRAVKAAEMLKEWYSKCDIPQDIEYLIGLDADDSTIPEYIKLWKDRPRFGRDTFQVGDTHNTVQVINNLAKSSVKESLLLVMCGDDHSCPEHWDTELLKVVADIDCMTQDMCIGVDDGINQMTRFLISIMTRSYYNRLGYVLYPEYRFCRADDDWMWGAITRGILRTAPHLTFRHNHWSVSGNPIDETYKRIMNDDEMRYGWEVYQRRQADNFGVK